MTDVLLTEMEYNGKTWYLSYEGYLSENYYAPYLAKQPQLELGQIKGGFIGVRLGNVSIVNKPNDRFAPFSIFSGGYKKLLENPTQEIPITIKWQQNEKVRSVFDGTMYLKTFGSDAITFLLENKYDDIDLLQPELDIKSNFQTVGTVGLSCTGTTVTVTAPDHGFETGDLITVSNSFESLNAADTPITVIDDNFFSYELSQANSILETSASVDINGASHAYDVITYGGNGTLATIWIGTGHGLTGSGHTISITGALNDNLNVTNAALTIVTNFEMTFDTGSALTVVEASGTYVMQFKEKKPAPFSFGTVQMKGGLIQKADGIVGDISGFTYANPQLIHNDIHNPLQLYDDGILVGTTNPANSSGFLKDSTTTPIKNGDRVTFTTTTVHQAKVGDQVSISGVTEDVYNGFFIIIGTPTEFTFDVYNNSRTVPTGISGSNNIFIESNYFGVDRLPTADDIFSRAIDPDAATGLDDAENGVVLLGQPYVSGKSSNGTTLADFFVYVADKLNITNVNFKQAPDASSLNLSQWVDSQTKLIDFAGKIAEGANYLFEIKNDELRVIDRSIVPDEITFIPNREVVSTAYKIPYPAKALRSVWSENVPNTTVTPATIESRPVSVMVSNSPAGKIVDVPYVTTNIEDQRTVLNSVKQILNKPVVDMTIGNVRTDIMVGTRIQSVREEDGLSIDMIVRTVSYDFAGLTTKVSGDGNIKVIEKTDVY